VCLENLENDKQQQLFKNEFQIFNIGQPVEIYANIAILF